MIAKLRTIASYTIPSAFHTHAAFLLSRWYRGTALFSGDYATWEDGVARSRGYADPENLIQARATASALRSWSKKQDSGRWDLSGVNHSGFAVAALLWTGLRSHASLHVVDFGGSLGSSYFQLSPMLRSIPDLRWAVVEQPHFVSAGTGEFADGQLTFHESINNALDVSGRDVLLLSGVLQYLPDPYGFIRQISQYGFEHILVDRTPFHFSQRDRITVQENPTTSGKATTYPAWFFNEGRFLSAFQPQYQMLYSFDGKDCVKLLGGNPYYRGFLFQRGSYNNNR